MTDAPSPDPAVIVDAIDFYWRPGCGFCMALERKLTRAGVPLRKHDIWEDPADAATVRSIANGNETVPTVVVGTIAMVNPSLGEVIGALAVQAPHLVPAGGDDPGPIERIASRLFDR